MRREWLALMANAPIAGEVKPRLNPVLGPDAASRLYCAFIQDTIATMRAVVEKRPSVRLALCAAGLRPDRDVFADVDLRDMWLMVQLGSTLGDRLEVCCDVLFTDRNADSVVVIAPDSPTLPSDYVSTAFEVLEAAGSGRVVVGPSSEGGHYLLGANSPQPALFEQIDWGSSTAVADASAKAKSKGLELELLADWYDVDSQSGLDRLRMELMLSPESAPKTAAVLASL